MLRSGATKLASGIVLAAAAAIGSSPAQAYTFTFDDIVYIANTAGGRNNNGSTNFAAAFPNYTPPPGYSSNGFYQVIRTANRQPWSGLTPSSNPAPTYIFRVGAGPGAFIQNDPLDTTTPPSFPTSTEDRLLLSGWTAPTTNGVVVDKVSTTTTSNSFAFTGPTGNGLQTTFTFNSFDLTGTAQGAVFEVLNSSLTPIYTSQALNLSGTNLHVKVNARNAWEVVFVTDPGGATITMDNVEINDPIPAVPEPLSLAVFGTGLLGLALARRRSARADGPNRA